MEGGYNSSPNKSFQFKNGTPGDSGLSAILIALKNHPQEFLPSAIQLFVQFGKSNYMELFTHQLKQLLGNENKVEYMELVHDIFVLVAETSIAKEALLNNGVFD